MSVNWKRSTGGTMVLVLLGVAALCGGEKWLALLIPAAMMVWYGVGSVVRSGGN